MNSLVNIDVRIGCQDSMKVTLQRFLGEMVWFSFIYSLSLVMSLFTGMDRMVIVIGNHN